VRVHVVHPLVRRPGPAPVGVLRRALLEHRLEPPARVPGQLLEERGHRSEPEHRMQSREGAARLPLPIRVCDDAKEVERELKVERLSRFVRCGAILATVAFAVTAGAGRALGGTTTVPNNGDAAAAGEALMSALAQAAAGDVIALSPGDYNPTQPLDISKNVT